LLNLLFDSFERLGTASENLKTKKSIMKKITSIITVSIVALSLSFTACSKKGAANVDTAKLEQIFQSADGSAKSSVNEAVAAVKNADYAGALTKLQAVAKDAKLTPEQQAAIKDVIEQVRTALSGAADKAVEGANKAAGDLQKSLGK